MAETTDQPAPYLFDLDTQLESVGSGKWRTTITDRWTALGGEPNGGYLLSVCVKALTRVVSHPHPLVVAGFFLRRGATGPADIVTEVVRTGRRLSNAEAHLSQDGKEVVRASAVYGDLGAAEGPTLVLNRPPELPPPEDAIDPLGGGSIPGVTIADQMEYRAPAPPGWTQGNPTGDLTSEFWMRFRDGRPVDPNSLALLVDAAPPAVMELGAAGSLTIELTLHVRGLPKPGWLACRAVTRHVIDGFHEEDFEIWDAQGELVAQSRQLAMIPVSP